MAISNGTGRAPYRAPTLRHHGTVAEMTQETPGGAELDNAQYNGAAVGPTS